MHVAGIILLMWCYLWPFGQWLGRPYFHQRGDASERCGVVRRVIFEPRSRYTTIELVSERDQTYIVWNRRFYYIPAALVLYPRIRIQSPQVAEF